VTHNLSEAKNHSCRPHSRGSVRRASGFVLTGYSEGAGSYHLLVKRRLAETKSPGPTWLLGLAYPETFPIFWDDLLLTEGSRFSLTR
jgi:hypothetical protein